MGFLVEAISTIIYTSNQSLGITLPVFLFHLILPKKAFKLERFWFSTLAKDRSK